MLICQWGDTKRDAYVKYIKRKNRISALGQPKARERWGRDSVPEKRTREGEGGSCVSVSRRGEQHSIQKNSHFEGTGMCVPVGFQELQGGGVAGAGCVRGAGER